MCINSIKELNYLPILLFGAAAPIIAFGLFGQPTNLGFAVFGCGICLASTKGWENFIIRCSNQSK